MSEKWTVQVITKDSQRTVSEHDIKHDAVIAMMAIRKPGTRINRIGRSYVVTPQE
jgi:hypothetical protein